MCLFKEVTKVKWGHRVEPQTNRTGVLEEKEEIPGMIKHKRKAYEDSRTRYESASQKKYSHQKPALPGTLNLKFQPLELWENTCLLFCLSHLACGTFCYDSRADWRIYIKFTFLSFFPLFPEGNPIFSWGHFLWVVPPCTIPWKEVLYTFTFFFAANFKPLSEAFPHLKFVPVLFAFRSFLLVAFLNLL